MPDRVWEFWIDVGGTFTDCVARRPDGALVTSKVLSSGVTKGYAAIASGGAALSDPLRQADPPAFWVGYQCRTIDPAGQLQETRTVVAFQQPAGRLVLDRPLAAAAEGCSYELCSGEESPLLAVRRVLGIGLSEELPPLRMLLGTTRGTNALLERKGARTAFATTQGFADILAIGYQNRPQLFALEIRKPALLYERAIELHERIAADGTVIEPLDEAAAEAALQAAHADGCRALAVCLLNAYRNPVHEQRVGRIAERIGFPTIVLSSQCAPLIKLVSRGDTTVLDAYLTSVIRDYVGTLKRQLGPRGELLIMTSAGGLVTAEQFVGHQSLLSGPAGGVVGYARVADEAGVKKAIGFDMGGTSTDVSRYDGSFCYTYETEKAGVRIAAPTLDIETVAAGGGSICRFDGQKLVVGPQSAGANPGPACYGRGGPLAVTDVNLVLGRILQQHFPFPLDKSAALQRLREIAGEIAAATGKTWSPEDLAEGFVKIANANMASPIRTISIARGYDVREYALISFGGAGAQHGCAVARSLDIRTILVHPFASLLSAFGIGQADLKQFRQRQVLAPLDAAALEHIEPAFREMEEDAGRALLASGMPAEQIVPRRMLDLRYRGQDTAITVTLGDGESPAAAFERMHRQLYGYCHEGRPMEVVAARLEVTGRTQRASLPRREKRPGQPTARERSRLYAEGRWQDVGVYLRENLLPGDRMEGPAIVCEENSTVVVDPGWTAEVTERGELLLEDRTGAPRERLSTAADPVTIEIFNNRFASIAEQMGTTLRKTAMSTNVKERLDFSCAVFTAAGDLVVNAPHIPVHLGAMGETVRAIRRDNPHIAPGDVFVTNDPYHGGSHLPDITVVTPVHDPRSGELLFFTGNRAHHAELGGKVPGSMPPDSRRLSEEGVLIRNFRLIAAGQPRWEALAEILAAGPYPSRAVHENLADHAAQVAANKVGAELLLELVERASKEVVLAYMGHIRNAAEAAMRKAIRKLPRGSHAFTDHLDDGSPIAVTLTAAGDDLTIDFTGSGGVIDGNLNANPSIVRAAVLYCFRCLIEENIPLNDGVLAPLRIVLPAGLLNPPAHEDPQQCPAVVGGNVETSQRIVDAIFGALGCVAASQGTMNSFCFGNDTFGYVETVAGGAGAGPGFAGASAVHTHMTNTRLTDPEILEVRYPVRVRRFGIRRGSGGAGQFPGGDGVVREIVFLTDMQCSILSERRGTYRPYGLAGGQPGAAGKNTIVRADGRQEDLGGKGRATLHPGDAVRIETPGGGGYGIPVPSNSSRSPLPTNLRSVPGEG